MKINDIASVIRKENHISFFRTEDGTQWVMGKRVAYPLYGLPELNEDSLRIILSIPGKDSGKYIIKNIPCPVLSFSDSADGETMLDNNGLVSIGYGGQVLYPARTTEGLRFYDPIYLKPIKESFEIYERRQGEITYLAVKTGFVLMAIIIPEQIDVGDMMVRIGGLHEELSKMYLRSHKKVDPSTGEVLEESYED